MRRPLEMKDRDSIAVLAAAVKPAFSDSKTLFQLY